MPSRPKGILAAIGGNEDKTANKAVLRRVLDLPKDRTEHVEVIPTASSLAKELAKDYIRAFEDLGVRRVGVLDIRERKDADDDDYARRVHDAHVVYMTGGDQLRLVNVLGGSKVGRAILDTYEDGGVVAGTSAGAAAMSTAMIAGDDGKAAMRKGSVQMMPGLGLLPDCIVDTHFMDRGRVGRLLEVVSANPAYVGLGVSEDTGMVVREGRVLDVVGSGVVVVVDGHEVRTSNLSQAGSGEPLAVERFILHTLVEGFGFDLEKKEYLPQRKKE